MKVPRSLSRPRWLVAAVLSVAMLSVVACGGDDDEPAATATTGASPTTAASVEATSAGPEEATITDVIGREVTLTVPVESMLLSEGRLMYVVAPLETADSPFERVVGWGQDLKSTDKALYEYYLEQFPEAGDLTVFGSTAQGAFSVEEAIALAPDVVVLTLDSYNGAKDSGLMDQLDSAGIPVVVVDFRQSPLENTVPTLTILGEVMGNEETASQIAGYYTENVELVNERLEGLDSSERPETFLFRAAGLGECCGTFGSTNLGTFVEEAGGVNIGSQFGEIYSLTINPEEVIASSPELIVVTGSDWRDSPTASGYVGLGFGADEETARGQLQDLINNQPGWTSLPAAEQGQVFAIWHQFYTSPWNFIALVQIAKWQHPELFEDVDPDAIFAEFHEQFLPEPYDGTYWVSIQ